MASAAQDNGIQLVLQPSGWVAVYDGPHAAEVVRLFGRRAIPTAFGPSAPASVVFAEVSKRNPGVQVVARVKKAA